MSEQDRCGEHEVCTWELGPSRFVACPTLGAKLWKWDLTLSGGRVRPVIYWPGGQPDPDPSSYNAVRGGNPILFPFAGRSYVDGKEGFWKHPDGQLLPIPIHGIARSSRFELEHLDSSGFRAVLVPDEAAMVSYPFRYRFVVQVDFDPLGLGITMHLENQDTCPIPWSAGHHFYFAVPWHPGGARGDYAVTLASRHSYRRAQDGSLEKGAGLEIPISCADESAIDVIHGGLKSSRIVLAPRNGEEPVTLIHGPSARPDKGSCVVTWTSAPDSPFYCVEPWMGPPNAPAHRVGLHWVEPGQSQQFLVRVRLDE